MKVFDKMDASTWDLRKHEIVGEPNSTVRISNKGIHGVNGAVKYEKTVLSPVVAKDILKFSTDFESASVVGDELRIEGVCADNKCVYYDASTETLYFLGKPKEENN